MSKVKYASVFILLLIICVLFNGCLIHHRSYTHQASPERPIPRHELEKVEPGVTTKEWVLDTFGAPTGERYLKDDVEILLYETRNRTEHEFSLFLIFSSESSEESKEILSFEIKDGVVQRYWFDR